MLKVIASFLISIFYINILFGQFYSVDVTIDDRLLRSDEKHEIVNLKNDVQNFFLNTVWDDNYRDLDINLYVQIVFEGVTQKGNETIYDLDIITFKGNDCIYEEMEGLRFKIGPKSFYQTNSAQAYELYKITRDFADISEDDLVYDLYTGTGTIAQFVSRKAKKVVGVESVPEAIKAAKENAKNNSIDNCDFYVGDMKEVFTEQFISENGHPDVIITDPPRDGMHKKVVGQILDVAPKKVVYVSCNPATQARDLALMNEHYKVTRVQPVDMFPQTFHVENVVLLEKR